jgi:hypothetical protein
MRLVQKAVTFGLWDGDQRPELNVIGSTRQAVQVDRCKPDVRSVSVLVRAIRRARTLARAQHGAPRPRFADVRPNHARRP